MSISVRSGNIPGVYAREDLVELTAQLQTRIDSLETRLDAAIRGEEIPPKVTRVGGVPPKPEVGQVWRLPYGWTRLVVTTDRDELFWFSGQDPNYIIEDMTDVGAELLRGPGAPWRPE